MSLSQQKRQGVCDTEPLKDRDEFYKFYPEALWEAFHDAQLVAIDWRDSGLRMAFRAGWPRFGEEATTFEWELVEPFDVQFEGETPEPDDRSRSRGLPPDAQSAARALAEAIAQVSFEILDAGAKDESGAEVALVGCFNCPLGQAVTMRIHASRQRLLINGSVAHLGQLLRLGTDAWERRSLERKG